MNNAVGSSKAAVPNDRDSSSAQRHMLAVNAFLQLMLDSQKLGAARLCVEADPGGNGASVVFYRSEGDAGFAELKRKDLLCNDILLLEELLTARACFWPDVGDEAFATNSGKQLRIHIAPQAEFRLQADYSSQRAKGKSEPVITLDNIQRQGISPLLDRLRLSAAHRHFVSSCLGKRQGLILTNSSEGRAICGASIIMALRPDAVFFPDCSTVQAWQEALHLAAKNLVVVSLPSSDPIDLLFRALGSFNASPGLRNLCRDHLLLSFVHTRVKHSCSACLRSTQVPADTIQRLPEKLRESAPTSYMFSRGCNSCGNSAYRGTVGLESAVLVDEEIRSLLAQERPVEEAAAAAYLKGTRTLLEDGLEKIAAGLSSFEEVFKVAPTVPPSFIAAIDCARSPQPPRGAAKAGDTAQPAVKGRVNRILIIEDDGDQRDVLEVVFRNEGYNVVSAENGVEALRLINGGNFDVIVCDVMMPVMNGMEFLNELRSGSHGGIPVLMLTAVGDSDDEYHLLSQGADDYCQKNVKRKVLLKRVERLLAKKKPQNPVGHLLSGD